MSYQSTTIHQTSYFAPSPLYPSLYPTPSAPIEDQQPIYLDLRNPSSDAPAQNYIPTQNYVPAYSNNSPRQALTQAMRDSTTRLLAKASEISSSILYSSTRHSSHTQSINQPLYQPVVVPAVVHNHYDFSNRSRNYNILSSHTENHTTINRGNRRGEERKSENNGLRILFGLVSTAIVLGGAYFLGKSNAENEDMQDEKNKIDSLKEEWATNKPIYQTLDTGYCGLVNNVTKHMDSILQRKQANKTHKFALVAFYLAAGVVGLTGSLLAANALMGLGLAIGVGATAFALYKIGYSFFSKRDEKDAQAIANDLNTLRHYSI
jgi:hypothetical protein